MTKNIQARGRRAVWRKQRRHMAKFDREGLQAIVQGRRTVRDESGKESTEYLDHQPSARAAAARALEKYR